MERQAPPLNVKDNSSFGHEKGEWGKGCEGEAVGVDRLEIFKGLLITWTLMRYGP